MLFNFNRIQNKVLTYFGKNKINLTKDELSSLFQFLNEKNLIKEGIIDKIYLHDEKAPFFINETQVLKIEDELKKSRGFFLPLSQITQTSHQETDPSFLKFNVKSFEDYEKVVEMFIDVSVYGKSLKEQEAIKNEKKLAQKTKKEKQLEKVREEKNELFDKISSLENDYKNKKVLSIDLEFFLNKRLKTHTITEIGLAFKSPNNVRNENFLVKENYELKENREKQLNNLFGETKVVVQKDLIEYLRVFIGNMDYLIFHEPREDLRALQQVGLDIEKEFPNVTIIDTQMIYKRYFFDKKLKTDAGESLSNLLKMFHIDFDKRNMHNAANDAKYTLDLLFAMKERAEKFKDYRAQTKELSEEDPLIVAMRILQKESQNSGLEISDVVKALTMNLERKEKNLNNNAKHNTFKLK